VIKRAWQCLLFVSLFVLAAHAAAFAQGSSNSSISGTVVDAGGGIIPGASVLVKGESGEQFEAITNTEGVFNVPGVGAGAYKVTVTLAGFKTTTVDVRVLPNTPISIKATLEVGSLEETVVVTSSSELINTQTATVAATLNADQLNRMPTPTRNALNAVTFLPGVNTSDTNRESRINGLPESFIQITLDGVSNNDNFLRSTDSFFASITPRQDAVEAVSVVTAAGGANVGGSGAVSINFQTRSGTNRFSGTAYEYFRHPDLNSNNWLNIRNGEPKNDVKLNQYGGRIGGPIVIPRLFDGRGKAFYMVHYEQLRFPNSFNRTRVVLNPAGLNGVFRYDVAGQTREVNVLELAARNNQISAIDPTTMSLLQRIQTSTGTTGDLIQRSDPMLMDFTWQSPGNLFEHQPTVRLDFNLSDRHRLSGTYANIWAERDPDYLNNADRRFPGSPVYRLYYSVRPLYRAGLRSTLTPTLVSELSGGITALGGSSAFGSIASNGVPNFDDQTGFAVDLDPKANANNPLTNWHTENTMSWRAAPTFSIDESLTWQRGTHSVNFGGGFLHVSAWENAQQFVPGIQIGFNQNNDPAAGLFTGGATGNFLGANAAQLNAARDLYALLTGRVTSVTGQAALDADTNKYIAFAPRRRSGYINMYSAYLQDSWRATSTLTLNGGVRWDVQRPFTAVNDVMSAATMASVCGMSGFGDGSTYNRCNFGTPGVGQNPANPEYVPLSKGTQGYNTDWNNVSPNVGVAWRPNVQDGFMRKLLGDPEQATLRAGYAIAYDRQGLDQFTGVFGPNPGSTLSLTRDESTGLVGAGESWPVLLSQRNRLFNAPFPETPTYPILPRPGRADDMRAFAPDIKIGMAQTWTVSFQRSITRDTAVDIRYVGTRGSSQWSTINYNQRQIEGNGFLDEFRLAQQNLIANNASGVANRRGSFAYFGAGTGTVPLPIYLAYLNGSRDVNNPAAYSGGTQTWTNTGITQDLVQAWPNPYASAADLDGNLTRRNQAATAGLPANFFVVNPIVNTLNVTDSGAYSDYHALQIDLRRRLSRGLSTSVNYQYAIERGSQFRGFRYGREMQDAANVRHAFKTQWDWTVPVGRGQRFGSALNPILDGIIGGWSVNGVGRVQDRAVNVSVDAANDNNFTGVQLVGMTKDELQSMFKHSIRINPANGLPTVYMLPDDVILNTRRAFNVDPTSATGYSELGIPEGRFLAPAGYGNCIQLKAGDCAPPTLLIRMPWFVRFDLGVTKKFPIKGATNFELRFDVLNLFNNVNFDPVTQPGTGAGIFQTTGFYDDPSNTYDPGGRIGSVMFRINW
jgi:hypothetical protein